MTPFGPFRFGPFRWKAGRLGTVCEKTGNDIGDGDTGDGGNELGNPRKKWGFLWTKVPVATTMKLKKKQAETTPHDAGRAFETGKKWQPF